MRIIIDGLSKIGKSFLFNELMKYTKKSVFIEPKYNECELQNLTQPPQKVFIFYKMEMNYKRLDRVLFLDYSYSNKCPDNQGT